MKWYNSKFALLPVFFIAFLSGCGKDNGGTDIEKDESGVEIVINGGISKGPATKGDGRIDPQGAPYAGLPPHKLDVGIVTVNYTTVNPLIDQPTLAAWSGSTADITRGYFGGDGVNGPNSTIITTGEIFYTSDDGMAVQKVFYDETGQHYFVRVIYPYDNAEFTQTSNGAGILFSDMDGSNDIMCSNLGWGNLYNPEIRTGDAGTDSIIILSHMLSLFRVNLEIEADAQGQYGQIESVRIAGQPDEVVVDMMDPAIYASVSSSLTDYYTIGFTPFSFASLPDPTVIVPAGYVMVMPSQTFTVEIKSEKRLWLSAEIDFTTAEDPFATSAAGTIYDINLTLREAYQMEVDIVSADEWWMDTVFD